jgi:very-long-chain ceramide synthase
MSRTSIGWFNTSEFWSTYPMVRMDAYLKAYYLIQSAYWTQQALMMLLKVEKPRADYLELVAHVSHSVLPTPLKSKLSDSSFLRQP